MSLKLFRERDFVTGNTGGLFYNQLATNKTEETTMCNVGGIDRALRIIVGLALISLVFTGPQVVWGWVGLVPLLTGIFKFCPAYALFGIKTCSTER